MANLTVMNMLFVLQNFNIDKCHIGFYGSLFSFDFAFCVFEAKCLSLSLRKVFLCNILKMKLFKSFWLKWSACVLVNSSEGGQNLNRSESGQNHFSCTCVLYICLMIFICSYLPWDICLFMCVWRYSYISCCGYEGYQILFSRNCTVYSFLLENLQQMCKCCTFVYEIRLRYWPERPKNLWI